jgi:starch synthase
MRVALGHENWRRKGLKFGRSGYPGVLKAFQGETIHHFNELFGGPAELLAQARRLFVVHAPHLFSRDGNPYVGPDGLDWPDNAQRFAAFSCLQRNGMNTDAGWTRSARQIC